MSNALTAEKNTMPIPVITDDLNSYLAKIANIDLLTVEEEQKLARRLRNDEDLDAARQLVMSQLRFVVHIARTYKGYGLPMADLVQEGNIGLMKAVKRFDPDVGVRLISFAVHWIRAEIHEYVIRNWRIVKVATTKSQRKLFFKLRSAKKQLNWFSQEEVEAVAADLGVDTKVVVVAGASLPDGRHIVGRHITVGDLIMRHCPVRAPPGTPPPSTLQVNGSTRHLGKASVRSMCCAHRIRPCGLHLGGRGHAAHHTTDTIDHDANTTGVRRHPDNRTTPPHGRSNAR